MAKIKRVFNVWAAYVDMFSNLMAMLLMVGLVAAAAGGSTAGSQRQCTLANDDEISAAMHDLAGLFAVDLDTAQSTADCMKALVPEASGGDSATFVRFPRGDEVACWHEVGRYREGCPTSRPKGEDEANFYAMCDDIARVLERNQDQIEEDPGTPEIKLTIRGHASEDWGRMVGTNCKLYGKAAEDVQRFCNDQLSQKRAEWVHEQCYQRWKETLRDKDILASIEEKISVLGSGYLDRQVQSAFESGPQQRRVTIDFHLPGKLR